MTNENRFITINREFDIITARKKVREIAQELGFGRTDITRIVTAASELARNIFLFAKSGIMKWNELNNGGRIGLELIFEDNGPGIPDIQLAMTEGYSTKKGLGMGLPGSKRLMDELIIQSEVGKGTTVIIRKWKK